MKKSKRLFTFLLALCMLITVFAAAPLSTFAEEADIAEVGETYTSGFYEYTRVGDEVTITKYTGSAINLVLPVSLDGYTVAAIGAHAFQYCGTLVKVTIPNSVSASITRIEQAAFANCGSLKSVNIPPSVTYIGIDAFSGCSSLSEVTIPDSVITIDNGAFSRCTSLEKVTLGSSLKTIGSTAFEGYRDHLALNSITIPASVTMIGNYAFGYRAYNNDRYRKEGFTIKGYTGSDAERYAFENDFTFVSLGNIPVVIDPEAPSFTVSDAIGVTGHDFTVDVAVNNNPGITALSLLLDYPEDFTLKAVEYKQVFSSKATGGNFVSPFRISWHSPSSRNESSSGVIATLTFTVAEDAVLGDKPITLTYDRDDVFDISYNSVDFAAQGATISVRDHYPGDMNSDDKVNMKDIVLLQQYINGWRVNLTDETADVTGDGKVNMKDVVLIQQFVNGWEVVLK